MDFYELVKDRYSVRKFKPDPVEPEKLEKILQAGRCAPSAHNNQPQRVYVAQSEQARNLLAQISPCTFDAPAVLVVCFDTDRERKSLWNPGYAFGETDAAIVTTMMMLQAWELGIGSCWVGMFNKDNAAKMLGLPEYETVLALLPIGYPADECKPGPLHAQRRPAEETITYL